MSQFSYDATVKSLVSAGVPEARAIARARELHPDVAAQLDVQAERKAGILEKNEQRAVWKMGKAAGFEGYWLSQARDTKQTPGLPDLWFANYERRLCFWWETKRQVGGARSEAQLRFARECEAAGIPYGFGDRYHFAEFLKAHGITPPAIPTD